MPRAAELSFNRCLDEPIYWWAGSYYSALTLEWILLESNDELESISRFWSDYSTEYKRQLALIETEPAWVLVSTIDDNIILESITDDFVPEKLSELQMQNVFLLDIPKLDSLEVKIYDHLPSKEVTPFNQDVLDKIHYAIETKLPLTNMGVNISQFGRFEYRINKRSTEPLIYQHKYKKFRERPPLPEYLIIHGLKINFIPFDQIHNIQIERWIIDPALQKWVDPSNKIITLFTKNGLTYLVKARFDGSTNQIFPPLS